MHALERPKPSGLSPRRIYEALDRHVIGQERAKRMLAIAAYNHVRRTERRGAGEPRAGLLRKSNALLIGPTGSGKTHLARQLAAVLDVPFATVDATEYTEAGYYGRDVEQMITELLRAADGDVDGCQRGVVFIDEIDKIAARRHSANNGSGGRDIGGEGVQQALLKLLEGREIFTPTTHGPPSAQDGYVSVDTRDILFICAGTFGGLEGGRIQERSVGFRNGEQGRTSGKSLAQRLCEYGMLAELVGRLPVQVELAPLDEEEMLAILTDPPDSILREYRERLALEEVDVEFRECGLREIVRHAQHRDVGARGLRSVFEEVVADVMFHAPELVGQQMTVDRGFVQTKLAQ